MNFNYEELQNIVDRYNGLTKEDLFKAFIEASQMIEELKLESDGLRQGFDYWECQYVRLKEGVMKFKDSEHEIEDFQDLYNLLK